MKNTLKTIQTISKIAMILSRIVFVFSIVMAVISVVSIITISVITGDVLAKFGDITLKGLLPEITGITKKQFYAIFIAGIGTSVFQAIISEFSYRYFKKEQQAGTPFTLDGAKEFMTLGIIMTALSVASQSFASFVISSFAEEVKLGIDESSGALVIVGVMIIGISLIFRHGAELIEQNQGNEFLNNNTKE